MEKLSDMHETCGQCGFGYARIDTEGWPNNSARRVMCPVCGWTRLEEHCWADGSARLLKRSERRGYGAYRLVPPGGYSGYNAFHDFPDATLIRTIRVLLEVRGWKGYLTLWDETAGRARLVAGSPLQKFESVDKG